MDRDDAIDWTVIVRKKYCDQPQRNAAGVTAAQVIGGELMGYGCAPWDAESVLIELERAGFEIRFKIRSRMRPQDILTLTHRSETWLRNHECAWCGQTLWRALRYGCGAIYDKCNPRDKDFSENAKLKH